MTRETDRIVILITTSSKEEAHEIAELLLNQRKATCINIIPKIDSFFWRQDKSDSAQESLMIIKAKASNLQEITEMVKIAHSYEVPEIIALPIIGGSEDYLRYLDIAHE